MLTVAEAVVAATAVVGNYCTDPPPDVRAAAISKLASHYRDYPDDGITNTQFSDQSAAWKPSSRAMLDSGASALLAPWRRPRARLIEASK